MQAIMWLPLLIFACAWVSDDEAAARFDVDNDGTPWPADCDDANPLMAPTGAEGCDGLDNDCDGAVDEGAPAGSALAWLDGDGDGYGDAFTAVESCLAPEGYVKNADDCDDGDVAISPDGQETCDDQDNDCDGDIDEPDAQDTSTWYADRDDDGFGDLAVPAQACAQPSGYVADSADCDDTSAEVRPDADEVCNDGLDNNCDGGAPECVYEGPTLSVNTLEIMIGGESGTASVNFGLTARAADLNGDGVNELLLGADSSKAGGSKSGAVYIFKGPIERSAEAADAWITLYGAPNEYLGYGLAVLPNARARTESDDPGHEVALIMGAPLADDGATKDMGKAWMRYASTLVEGESAVSGEGSYRGEYASDRFGLSIVSGGDIDRDKLDDFIVASPLWDNDVTTSTTATNAGQICMYSGADPGVNVTPRDALACVRGTTANDQLGNTVAALGDINGEGAPDYAFGSTISGTTGAVWVAFDLPATWLDIDEFHRLDGESKNDFASEGLAGAGDIDGDGYDDLLVGAPGYDVEDRGAVYVVLGGADVFDYFLEDDLILIQHTRFVGENPDDGLGVVSGAGDFNLDGVDDLIVGAPGYDGKKGEDSGRAYLFFGPVSGGPRGVSEAELILDGGAANVGLGGSLAPLGDVTGDGYPDLWLGAPDAADSSAGTVGLGYILPGLGL
jgi:hypothetical protein